MNLNRELFYFCEWKNFLLGIITHRVTLYEQLYNPRLRIIKKIEIKVFDNLVGYIKNTEYRVEFFKYDFFFFFFI